MQDRDQGNILARLLMTMISVIVILSLTFTMERRIVVLPPCCGVGLHARCHTASPRFFAYADISNCNFCFFCLYLDFLDVYWL